LPKEELVGSDNSYIQLSLPIYWKGREDNTSRTVGGNYFERK
jgi:hypothetical protein